MRREMTESLTVAIMLYSHFIFVIFRMLHYYFMDKFHSWNLAPYLSLILSFDVISACCIYFFPKILLEDDIPKPRIPFLKPGPSVRHVFAKPSSGSQEESSNKPPRSDCAVKGSSAPAGVSDLQSKEESSASRSCEAVTADQSITENPSERHVVWNRQLCDFQEDSQITMTGKEPLKVTSSHSTRSGDFSVDSYDKPRCIFQDSFTDIYLRDDLNRRLNGSDGSLGFYGSSLVQQAAAIRKSWEDANGFTKTVDEDRLTNAKDDEDALDVNDVLQDASFKSKSSAGERSFLFQLKQKLQEDLFEGSQVSC
jgi:hypothetical protein